MRLPCGFSQGNSGRAGRWHCPGYCVLVLNGRRFPPPILPLAQLYYPANRKFAASPAYDAKEVVFLYDKRGCGAPCPDGVREKLFPICRIGQALILIGIGLGFLSFVFGFWLALLGAILVLTGFCVVQYG